MTECLSACPSLPPVDALDAVPSQILFNQLAVHDSQKIQTCCS